MGEKDSRTYHIETMGCQMNERDSETIAGILEAMGYARVSSPDGIWGDTCRKADIIVINTCSVRENADNRFFGLLGRIKKVKESNPQTVVAVCGCMMQQQHIVDRIKSIFGWVDIVFGTHNIHEFSRLLSNVTDEKAKVVSVWDEGGEIVEDLPSARKYPFKAFVNITRGCNNFCTYCIVPYTRGREQSREPERIIAEARQLCADGVKEITLLGQNVNSYATQRATQRDGRLCEKSFFVKYNREISTVRHSEDTTCRHSGDTTCRHSGLVPESIFIQPASIDAADIERYMDFPDLLYLLSEVEGLSRIRFMTSHPKDFSDKLVRAFAELEKLCPGVHLPVQAGSDRILERMNRGYTKETYLSLLGKLREARPDIVITTDLIVGFPGETAEDFEETMDLIERARFDSAFTFLFSPRKGTPAAEYDMQVPEDVKHRRFNRMVERVNAITLEKNRVYVGKTERVLAEGRSKTDETMLTGRTAGGKLVNFAADGRWIGNFADVEIIGVNTFSFIGRVKGEIHGEG
jgi:tRNA-2-methylthio-N6-dimethylallyladenosine synthase